MVLVDHPIESSSAPYGHVHPDDDGRGMVGWPLLPPLVWPHDSGRTVRPDPRGIGDVVGSVVPVPRSGPSCGKHSDRPKRLSGRDRRPRRSTSAPALDSPRKWVVLAEMVVQRGEKGVVGRCGIDRVIRRDSSPDQTCVRGESIWMPRTERLTAAGVYQIQDPDCSGVILTREPQGLAVGAEKAAPLESRRS